MSHVLTFVASTATKAITAELIKAIQSLIQDYEMTQTAAVSWLSADKAADIGLADAPDAEFLHDLKRILTPHEIDVFSQAIEGRKKKLLLADMDSTIVTGETLDELAEFAGLKDQIAAITAKAMEGELDFHSVIRERVKLLKGLDSSALQQTLEQKTQISIGARQLVRTMSRHGAFCVLVSGGFTFFTEEIAAQLGFNKNHGNTLQIYKNQLTGMVVDPIQDRFAKLAYLNEYCKELKITANDVMAIGDGANDIPMLEAAGLGIGYKPKKAVLERVNNAILYGDLTAALYAQGYTDHHINPPA